MGKIMLVTGGVRSGKSSFAEEQLLCEENVCYIATSVVKQKDADLQERILQHQLSRPSTWASQEQYKDLGLWIKQQKYSHYLLDCATMLTTNVLFDMVAQIAPDKLALDDDYFLSKDEQAQVMQAILSEWQQLAQAIKEVDATLWLVTNEVGMGIVPETRLGRFFRDVLGKVNQQLAKEAEAVYLVICGLPQQIK